MNAVDDSVLEYLLARAADPAGFERWAEQARTTGYCSHPVRLSGETIKADATTGEIVSRFATDSEPDGVLLKACGQRRTTACESCAALYRADAFQLIAAGLRGGKGVEVAVADRPAVFVTLTAPSFGAVHSRRETTGRPRPCRPRRGTCAHNRSRRCSYIHRPDDPTVGEPICVDCFDYRGAVLWNAHATELWRRTTIALRRRLARQLELTARDFAGLACPAYAKVVEYQRRGLIHVHAVVRIDPTTTQTLPSALDSELLAIAIRQAAITVSAPYPSSHAGAARWGSQIDTRTVDTEALPAGVIAAYIAKYATKSTEAIGRLDHRLRPVDLEALDVRDHLRRMVLTAWELGDDPDLRHLRLRAWAHTLGFRGHWLTKSRHYSTTLGGLRKARADWATRTAGNRPAADSTTAVKDWKYVERGWANPGDALLAATARQTRIEARTAARIERQDNIDGQVAAHP